MSRGRPTAGSPQNDCRRFCSWSEVRSAISFDVVDGPRSRSGGSQTTGVVVWREAGTRPTQQSASLHALLGRCAGSKSAYRGSESGCGDGDDDFGRGSRVVGEWPSLGLLVVWVRERAEREIEVVMLHGLNRSGQEWRAGRSEAGPGSLGGLGDCCYRQTVRSRLLRPQRHCATLEARHRIPSRLALPGQSESPGRVGAVGFRAARAQAVGNPSLCG